MKKILAVPGSLRMGSYNKLVCEAIVNLVADDVEATVFALDDIPFMNEDLEAELPSEVQALINAVAGTDAIIFSTPEYNNMVPGVLKNAIEWLSRGYAKEAVMGKPVAITGASPGGFGTVRAQNQLLLLLSIVGFDTDASLCLPISHAKMLFDKDGQLDDDATREKLSALVEKLLAKI